MKFAPESSTPACPHKVIPLEKTLETILLVPQRKTTTENGASWLKSPLPSREKSSSASRDVAQPCDVRSSTTAGIRYVRPYYFEFISHAKNRWAGKTIVDLFTEELKGSPRDYYLCDVFSVSSVKAGRIQVDGQIVPVSYIVQCSQKISHFLHRQEPPVMVSEVEILLTKPDSLTLRKPASVPVGWDQIREKLDR